MLDQAEQAKAAMGATRGVIANSLAQREQFEEAGKAWADKDPAKRQASPAGVLGARGRSMGRAK